jgi:hypothetical protein
MVVGRRQTRYEVVWHQRGAIIWPKGKGGIAAAPPGFS